LPWRLIFTIFEGTSEIQRMIVGRALTGADVRPEFVGVEEPVPEFDEGVQVIDSADPAAGWCPTRSGASTWRRGRSGNGRRWRLPR
jgi:hypothetical protein